MVRFDSYLFEGKDFNSGDLEAILALYEPGAVLVAAGVSPDTHDNRVEVFVKEGVAYERTRESQGSRSGNNRWTRLVEYRQATFDCGVKRKIHLA